MTAAALAALIALAAQADPPADPKCLLALSGHSDAVRSVEFSPDGSRLLSGSRDGTAILWDAALGKRLRVLEGHEGGVTCAAFSPDGRRVLTGSQDRTIVLWNAETGERLQTLKGHAGWIRQLAFTPDGKRAVSAGRDRKMITWDLATGRNESSFEAHPLRILSCAWSPDRRTALVGSDDHALALWDMGTGERARAFTGYQGWARFAALSPDGTLALTGSWDDSFWIWDAARGQAVHRATDHRAWVISGDFRSDGRVFATGDRDGKIHLRDVNHVHQVGLALSAFGAVHAVAFSPGGRFLAAGYETGEVRVWHPARDEADDLAWLAIHQGREAAARRKELEGLASDLFKGGWEKHGRAQERFIRAGAEGVAVLTAAAPPERTAPAGAENRAKLLKDLDSEEYAVRVKARKDLAAQGTALLPWLEEQLKAEGLSIEVRSSLQDVRAEIREGREGRNDRGRFSAVLLLAEMPRTREVKEALGGYADQAGGSRSADLARTLLGR